MDAVREATCKVVGCRSVFASRFTWPYKVCTLVFFGRK